MLRVGVLASGSGTNFQVLADAARSGRLPVEIAVLIYNNPGAYVAERARAAGIAAVLLDHRKFVSREVLDEEIASTLDAHGVELVVMAGWMRRVTEVLIGRFADRILNIHPSLLPAFRGAKAIEQALDYGVKVAGCTVHIVRLEVDAGPIILQAAEPVREEDTPETLAARIHAHEYRILPEAVRLFAEGQVRIEGNRARIVSADCAAL
ncbi:phosphoribosylglycinamide formyltransferase [Gloeobacter morelensis]|uniref:Phosphoribosylglycinamide formyltransferase n=1 Tax=Gloeobacter morelensis MG652769 TaxID=2781736 RepID=A0ABY3PII4_9CYAN|nr:phosphoribosylglycinamide formyltransferase [Gloeobacter morelensis]UFP93434.1 phosphoribosylglycinamide formyltransferase [Gloeobacter morelensis MG652769]